VNFTVTKGGLEDQLLGITMQHEQPEIERQKSASLRQEEDMKVQLSEWEKQLLQTLANSQGNILENEELIKQLDEIKASSESVNQALTESRQLQASLDEQREAYRPIAQKASLVFFLLKDSVSMNHCYRFSLGAFIKVYRSALEQSTGSTSVEARMKNLHETFVQLIVSFVSRALFKANRLTFVLYLPRNVEPEMFEDFRPVQESARDHDLPIALWAYPRGQAVKEHRSKEIIAYAARLGLEMGSDFTKVKYPRSKEAMEYACRAAADNRVLLSGGSKTSDRDFLELVEECLDAGISGLAVGRNVWQRENPYEMLDMLEAVVFEGKTTDDVL